MIEKLKLTKVNIANFFKLLVIILLIFSIFSFVCVIESTVQSAVYDSESVATLSQLGSRGDEVRKIQTKLKELGYYTGSIDGIYGTATQSAVLAFQKNCGITQDGIAGSQTLLYLGLGGSSSSSGRYSSSDIYLLAKLIEAEARGESYIGQVAVGAVVLNRVAHASFPDTIAGVIYQSGAFTAVVDSNWSVEPSATALKAAQDCINGWDPSGGAIYYYNPAKTSNAFIWSRPVITTIGNHKFCS